MTRFLRSRSRGAPARDAHRRDWEDLGALDPLWAVVSSKGKRFGRWDEAEFARTGERKAGDLLARLDELGVPRERARALDFGCGVGRLTLPLASRFVTVTGVDISEPMLAAARRRAIAAGVANVRFCRDAPPAEERFDLVYCGLVLQHQPDGAAALELARRLVDLVGPGGALVLQAPIHIAPHARIQPGRRAYGLLRRAGVPPRVLYERLRLQPMSMVAVRRADLDAVIERAGLQLLRADERRARGRRSLTLYAARP